MKINKVSSKSYDSVNTVNIIRYCSEYAAKVAQAVEDLKSGKAIASRTTLKTVAAELETVAKRLKNA